MRSLKGSYRPAAVSAESFDYVYRDIKEDVLLGSISGGTDIVSCFCSRARLFLFTVSCSVPNRPPSMGG